MKRAPFVSEIFCFISVSLYGYILAKNGSAPRPDPAWRTVYELLGNVGLPLLLEMHGLGDPAPTFTWSKGGLPVPGGQVVTQGLVSDLYFRNLTLEDYGEYVLKMENANGRYTATYHVHGTGKPETPTDLTALSVTSEYVLLCWQSGYDFGHRQTFYIMEKVEYPSTFIGVAHVNDTPPTNSPHRVCHVVHHLDCNTEYQFAVNSLTTVGVSNLSSPVTFNTTEEPGVPQDIRVTNVTTDSAVLSWRPGTSCSSIQTFDVMEWIEFLNGSSTFRTLDQVKDTLSDKDPHIVSYKMDSLVQNHDYTLVVSAENEAGVSDPSPFVTFRAHREPGDPTNLRVLHVSHYSVTLSWLAACCSVPRQRFVVMQAFPLSDGSKRYIAMEQFNDTWPGFGAHNVSHVINRLDDDTDYEVVVLAMNLVGASNLSNPLAFRTKRFNYSTKDHNNTGLIAGVVTGSVVFVVMVTAIVCITVRRKHRKV